MQGIPLHTPFFKQMNNIRVEHIFKSYSDLEVLHDVSLEIEKGSFVSIMGESGSGKSTLLNVMCANTRPEKGSVFIDDIDLTTAPSKTLANLRCSKIGIVYQFYNLIPTLTAKENILLPVFLRKDKVKPFYAKLDEIAHALKIEDCLNKLPENLSGGQQQRVAIARALIYSPEILFLDEPTGNLDSQNTEQIMQILKDLSSNDGVTVVQVTHSLKTAGYGNRILHISDGKIVKDEILS